MAMLDYTGGVLSEAHRDRLVTNVSRLGERRNFVPYPSYITTEVLADMRRAYLTRGWSERTLELDLSMLRMATKAGIDLQQPDKALIEALILRPKAANTRRSYRSRLGTLAKGLHAAGVISDEAKAVVDSVPHMKGQVGVPRPADPNGVKRLLTNATHPDVRDMVAFAVFAGMRVHEIAKVEGTHFQPNGEGYDLVIVGKGNKKRVVPAHPVLVEILERRRTLGRFWDVKAATVSQRIGDEMRRLDVGGRGSRAHTLRHRFATSALTASGDLRIVQQLLGHSSPAVTAIYTAVEDGRARNTVLALPDFTA